MRSEIVGIDISENLEDFCFHCKKADFVVRAFYDFNEDVPRTKYEFSCNHLGLCRQLAEHLKTTLPKLMEKKNETD